MKLKLIVECIMVLALFIMSVDSILASHWDDPANAKAIRTVFIIDKVTGKQIEVVDREVLVQFTANLSQSVIRNIVASKNCCEIRRKMRGLEVYSIWILDNSSIPEVIKLFESDPFVEYAEPNALGRLDINNVTSARQEVQVSFFTMLWTWLKSLFGRIL